MDYRERLRDLSQEYIARYSELQFCEIPIPYKEFYFHSQCRDKCIEFKMIKKITETIKHAEMLVENTGDHLASNRYPDILPYKDTLITPINSSYINSSLINGVGEDNKKMFIATQGPTEATTNNFWQLVWDYNVSLIIMPCNFIENEMEKCFQYFPNIGEINFGEFEVVLLKTHQKFTNLVERTIMLNHIESETHRIIKHYQCTAWPDAGIPLIEDEFQSMCYLINKIEQKWCETKGKIVVHCSAGVGRTGMLIAIYNMASEIKAEGMFSVFKTVRLLREQRWGMVANEEQYEFIYKFMEHWISSYILSNSL